MSVALGMQVNDFLKGAWAVGRLRYAIKLVDMFWSNLARDTYRYQIKTHWFFRLMEVVKSLKAMKAAVDPTLGSFHLCQPIV
jgi:hypothetical protein